MPDTPLTEIKTDLAVLIATMTQVREQLSRQNGALRQDHETLVKHGEHIATACKKLEDLPCQSDPRYVGRMETMVNTQNATWQRLWNALQAVALGVIVAKLQGWI